LGYTTTKKDLFLANILIFLEDPLSVIQIASPSADICKDCHIFFNRAKYNAPGTSTPTLEANSNSPAQLTNYCQATMTTSVEQEEEGANNNNDRDDEPYDLQLVETQNVELTARESSLLKATLHVKQAMIQQKLTNTKIYSDHTIPSSTTSGTVTYVRC
jgi:hypothetical protein